MACRKCFSNEFPWQTSRPHIKYKSLTPFNSVLCQAFHTSERLHSYNLPHRTYAPLPITHSPSGNHFCKLFSISTHSRRVERETFSSFRGPHKQTQATSWERNTNGCPGQLDLTCLSGGKTNGGVPKATEKLFISLGASKVGIRESQSE